MDTFKVGEIAIIKHCDSYPELIGEETTIMKPLAMMMVANYRTNEVGFEFVYVTDKMAPCGVCLHLPPHYLRKRRPPEQTTGELRIMSLFIQPFVRIPDEVKQ